MTISIYYSDFCIFPYLRDTVNTYPEYTITHVYTEYCIVDIEEGAPSPYEAAHARHVATQRAEYIDMFEKMHGRPESRVAYYFSADNERMLQVCTETEDIYHVTYLLRLRATRGLLSDVRAITTGYVVDKRVRDMKYCFATLDEALNELLYSPEKYVE